MRAGMEADQYLVNLTGTACVAPSHVFLAVAVHNIPECRYRVKAEPYDKGNPPGYVERSKPGINHPSPAFGLAAQYSSCQSEGIRP